MNSFGLDIGTSSIKAIQLQPGKDGFKLVNLGMAPVPVSLQSESEIDQRAIADSIKKLIATRSIVGKGAVLALPESLVFSRVVDMPPLTEEELKSAIKWEAEQYIPIPLEEASLDYQVVKSATKGEKAEKMEVFLVAVPKNVVDKYLKILKMANIQPLALETEMISICRALVGNEDSASHRFVVSIGSLSTDLAVTRGNQIVYTRSISTGGNALARAVARELNLEVAKAEEYKKSYGLDESVLEGKVGKAIEPIFDAVISEIRKSIDFCESKEGVKLKSMLLCGGTAKLPGLVGYLANALGLEVQVGDPFTHVIIEEKQKAELGDDAPLYTTAVGLAMKKV